GLDVMGRAENGGKGVGGGDVEMVMGVGSEVKVVDMGKILVEVFEDGLLGREWVVDVADGGEGEVGGVEVLGGVGVV
ncbi:hypothetical protein, partial [Paenibacillus sp. Y412MC10]|uniref:hypothetical protein n=1 Tax=Geobacillus sp. (strain Y412MC10) TaxID=481743 RepID=UPI001C92C421